MPIYLATGENLALTYNIYWILTSPLTAVAFWAIIRYLFHAPFHIALIGSLIFVFARPRDMHLGQFESYSTHFLVFSLYCLHRVIDKPLNGVFC